MDENIKRFIEDLLIKQRHACACSIKGTSELSRKTREIILSTPLTQIDMDNLSSLLLTKNDYI